jgi:hypothetical protein
VLLFYVRAYCKDLLHHLYLPSSGGRFERFLQNENVRINSKCRRGFLKYVMQAVTNKQLLLKMIKLMPAAPF